MVLSGHEHFYERLGPLRPTGKPGAGMRGFVVGTGGKDLRQAHVARPGSRVRIDDAFGILLLALHRASYTWVFVDEGGLVLDRGHARCR